MYKLTIGKNPDLKNPQCGVSISPYGEQGKEKSLIQLYRQEDDPKRKAYFKGTPGGFDGAVFMGDSNQDAKALRAAHLTAALAGRKAAGVLVLKSEIVGEKGQEKAAHVADVSVEKIEGNAQLLSKLADLAEKYYHK
ncbi:MAG TPA: hypothetical protein VJJ80_01485 [Patescibacteria group bacterium]|nr:hypothetical protein [Patescibacteria group bacterium]